MFKLLKWLASYRTHFNCDEVFWEDNHDPHQKDHPTHAPLQFAYRRNRSTDDAVKTAIHTALTHLENKDMYVQMLFIDYSSAFNTVLPTKLAEKLLILGLMPSLCSWVLNFLTDRPQTVRVGTRTSGTRTVSTGLNSLPPTSSRTSPGLTTPSTLPGSLSSGCTS